MKPFGISKLFPVKPLQILLNATALKLALSAKCFIYIVVCLALFIINLLQSKIRSIEDLLFLKKIVFRVGKKAMEDRQALLQFWVVVRLV
jgi:hypothetical protein